MTAELSGKRRRWRYLRWLLFPLFWPVVRIPVGPIGLLLVLLVGLIAPDCRRGRIKLMNQSYHAAIVEIAGGVDTSDPLATVRFITRGDSYVSLPSRVGQALHIRIQIAVTPTHEVIGADNFFAGPWQTLEPVSLELLLDHPRSLQYVVFDKDRPIGLYAAIDADPRLGESDNALARALWAGFDYLFAASSCIDLRLARLLSL